MAKFWAGFILGFVLVPLLVACYLVLGMAPSATSAPPMPLERFIAGTALNGRIRREASNREPAAFTVTDLVDGVAVYEKNCAACHGADRQATLTIGKAMYPEAPQLLTQDGRTDHPVEVIYWEVQNGIRLTGMPSFQFLLPDKQKWDVSAMLARVNTLPPDAERAFNPKQDGAVGCSNEPVRKTKN
jgi:mono/diheme cytochrome c family protein